MNLDKFISQNPERWANALAHAKLRKPWLRTIGPGLYRISRRPTDRDKSWRPHLVQFSVAGDRLIVSCDCDAYTFGNVCFHIARAHQYSVKRARKRVIAA